MKKPEALKIVMEDGEKLRILPDEFKKVICDSFEMSSHIFHAVISL